MHSSVVNCTRAHTHTHTYTRALYPKFYFGFYCLPYSCYKFSTKNIFLNNFKQTFKKLSSHLQFLEIFKYSWKMKYGPVHIVNLENFLLQSYTAINCCFLKYNYFHERSFLSLQKTFNIIKGEIIIGKN